MFTSIGLTPLLRHDLVVVVQERRGRPTILLGEDTQDLILRAVVGEMVAYLERVIGLQFIPIRDIPRLRPRFGFRLRLYFFVELVLRGDQVGVVRLIERDARLMGV